MKDKTITKTVRGWVPKGESEEKTLTEAAYVADALDWLGEVVWLRERDCANFAKDKGKPKRCKLTATFTITCEHDPA